MDNPQEAIEPEDGTAVDGNVVMQKLCDQIAQQSFAIATKDALIDQLAEKLERAEEAITALGDRLTTIENTPKEGTEDADQERSARKGR